VLRWGPRRPEAGHRDRPRRARSHEGRRAISDPPMGSEAPSANATARTWRRSRRPSCRICVGGSAATLRGPRRTTTSFDSSWGDALQRELAAAARAIPWGEVVSYGELAVLAGRPGAARAAGRSAPTTASRSSSPATASSRRTDRRLRLRRARAEAAPPGARGRAPVSARGSSTTSGPSWQRSRRRALRPARGDLGAVPHRRRPLHLAGGSVAFHLDLASSGTCGARSRSSELRVPAEIRTYPRASFESRERATSSTSRDRMPASTCSRRRGARRRPTCRSTGLPDASCRAPAVGRLPARRVPGRGSLTGHGRRTSRCERRPPPARRSAERCLGEEVRLKVERAGRLRARLREGMGGDRGLPARRRRRGHGARARGAERRSRRCVARRTGSRTPTTRTSSGRPSGPASARRGARASASGALESPRKRSLRRRGCACAIPRVAAGARRTRASPPDDESEHAAAAGEGGGAGGALRNAEARMKAAALATASHRTSRPRAIVHPGKEVSEP
jgi:hypothetical protein